MPTALVMLLISATALGIAVWSMSRGNSVCAAGIATATNTPLAALQTMAIHSSTHPGQTEEHEHPLAHKHQESAPHNEPVRLVPIRQRATGDRQHDHGDRARQPHPGQPPRERVELAHDERAAADGLDVGGDDEEDLGDPEASVVAVGEGDPAGARCTHHGRHWVIVWTGPRPQQRAPLEPHAVGAWRKQPAVTDPRD